ncbi:MAG: type II toxin-antitoxin system RelE/ParE family toxin [Desulfobulbus sp.]|nr:type II toxin-antitoxin system RelE/ParE family toxin [Desulfobulbus sp.]
MTKEFAKWADKHGLTITDLADALKEVAGGSFEADLGGHVLKKRVPFPGQGKRGSGRTIICFKKDDRAIFVHGFAKNEKANMSKKELIAFRRVAEILLNLSPNQIARSISTGTFIEVNTDEKDNG